MAIPPLLSATGALAGPPLAIHAAAQDDLERKVRASTDRPSEALISCGRWLNAQEERFARISVDIKKFSIHKNKLEQFTKVAIKMLTKQGTAAICGLGYAVPLEEIATLFKKVVLIGLDLSSMEEMIEKLPKWLRKRCEIKIIDLSGSITAFAAFVTSVERDFNIKLKSLVDSQSDTDDKRLELYKSKEEAILKFLEDHQPEITAVLPSKNFDFMLVHSLHNLVVGTIGHIIESTITMPENNNFWKTEVCQLKCQPFFLKIVKHTFNVLAKTIRFNGIFCEVDVVPIRDAPTEKFSNPPIKEYFRAIGRLGTEWPISETEIAKANLMTPYP